GSEPDGRRPSLDGAYVPEGGSKRDQFYLAYQCPHRDVLWYFSDDCLVCGAVALDCTVLGCDLGLFDQLDRDLDGIQPALSTSGEVPAILCPYCKPQVSVDQTGDSAYWHL